MSQEKYIGMDVHAATISAAVKNAEGKLLMGMRAGNQGSHDSGVHSRTAGNAGRDLRGRDLGRLVTRSAEAPREPAS